MTIDFAIDYDQTYSAHPELWPRLLRQIQAAGLKAICATNRQDTAANRRELFTALEGLVIDIVYCGGYKSQACRAKGYDVQVWIDNDPRVDRPPAPLWWCKLVGGLQCVLHKIRRAK